MLKPALQFIEGTLNQFLKNQFGLDENKVVLNNLVESNGDIPQVNQNKVIISLINIEKETNKPFNVRYREKGSADYADINPAERYNLDLLISASFDDYAETLKFLDASILFFQVNPVLNAGVSSAIPAGLGKLEFEIEKLSYHQMQGLWTSMGAKYQPSVVYKVRLISLQADQTRGFARPVTNIQNQLSYDAK